VLSSVRLPVFGLSSVRVLPKWLNWSSLFFGTEASFDLSFAMLPMLQRNSGISENKGNVWPTTVNHTYCVQHDGCAWGSASRGSICDCWYLLLVQSRVASHSYVYSTVWRVLEVFRGVDRICAEHLTVESCTVFICQQSYLLLFGIPSPTHSIIPGLKPSFSANPSHCSPSFLLLKYSVPGFPGLFTVISEHICFLLLVFFPVFTLFSCRLRAVD